MELLWSHYRVVESLMATEKKQARFPRSKRKRIRAKWAKQEKNFEHLPSQYILGGNTIVIHPVIANKLRRRLALEQERFEKKLIFEGGHWMQ